MNCIVKLYSENSHEICNFLEDYFSYKIHLKDKKYWQKYYQNPIELADIVAAFIDNKDKYDNTNMWVSIDNGVFINIKDDNYNYFIQYLFERYPY